MQSNPTPEQRADMDRLILENQITIMTALWRLLPIDRASDDHIMLNNRITKSQLALEASRAGR